MDACFCSPSCRKQHDILAIPDPGFDLAMELQHKRMTHDMEELQRGVCQYVDARLGAVQACPADWLLPVAAWLVRLVRLVQLSLPFEPLCVSFAFRAGVRRGADVAT